MPAPTFLTDVMLGRLARWLRVVGLDVEQASDQESDRELVARADAEGRVLLTRDRHLLRELRPARALEVTSEAPLAQLRRVVEAFDLAPPAEPFTRCLVDNAVLRDATDAERAVGIPERSRGLAGPVRVCPRCGRVYWPGSHVRRMRAAIERALPGWLERGAEPRGANEARDLRASS